MFKLNSYSDVISIMGLFTEIDVRDLAFVNKMAGARTAVCRRNKDLYLDSEELAFLACLKVQTVNNLKVRGVDGMPREPKGIVTTYIVINIVRLDMMHICGLRLNLGIVL